MASEYRKSATKGEYYSDLANYGYDDNKTVLVDETTISEVINSIETDVGEVINMLDDIKGLAEIDEAREKLEELSLKLY